MALGWLALSASAAAHPGHGRGGGDFSLLHHVVEPQHLLAAVAALLVSALCLRRTARAIRASSRLHG